MGLRIAVIREDEQEAAYDNALAEIKT